MDAEEITKPVVTNVLPLPPSVARKLYAQSDDDGDSIELLIKAQSTIVED